MGPLVRVWPPLETLEITKLEEKGENRSPEEASTPNWTFITFNSIVKSSLSWRNIMYVIKHDAKISVVLPVDRRRVSLSLARSYEDERSSLVGLPRGTPRLADNREQQDPSTALGAAVLPEEPVDPKAVEFHPHDPDDERPTAARRG